MLSRKDGVVSLKRRRNCFDDLEMTFQDFRCHQVLTYHILRVQINFDLTRTSFCARRIHYNWSRENITQNEPIYVIDFNSYHQRGNGTFIISPACKFPAFCAVHSLQTLFASMPSSVI